MTHHNKTFNTVLCSNTIPAVTYEYLHDIWMLIISYWPCTYCICTVTARIRPTPPALVFMCARLSVAFFTWVHVCSFWSVWLHACVCVNTYIFHSLHACFLTLILSPPGSAITYSAYIFPDKWVNSTFHQLYVPIAVLNTVVCTALSCYSRYTCIFHFTKGSPKQFWPKLVYSILALMYCEFGHVWYISMLWMNGRGMV